MGFEGPSSSGVTHVHMLRTTLAPEFHSTRNRINVLLTHFFSSSVLAAPRSALFSSRTSCPCLASGSHSLTWDVSPLRTALRDAPFVKCVCLTCDGQFEAGAATEPDGGDGFVLSTAGTTLLHWETIWSVLCMVVFCFCCVSQSVGRWYSISSGPCYASKARPSDLWPLDGPRLDFTSQLEPN